MNPTLVVGCIGDTLPFILDLNGRLVRGRFSFYQVETLLTFSSFYKKTAPEAFVLHAYSATEPLEKKRFS